MNRRRRRGRRRLPDAVRQRNRRAAVVDAEAAAGQQLFVDTGVEIDEAVAELHLCAVDLPQPLMKLISKTKPSDTEVDANPRARSAVLRVAERLPGGAA